MGQTTGLCFGTEFIKSLSYPTLHRRQIRDVVMEIMSFSDHLTHNFQIYFSCVGLYTRSLLSVHVLRKITNIRNVLKQTSVRGKSVMLLSY